MEAKEKLQQHLDTLFSDAPRTRAAYELREELLANSLERYHDLTRTGLPEQQALDSVLGSIGNVEELIAALPDADRRPQGYDSDERRRKSAMVTAVAIALYILAGVVFFAGVLVSSLYWDSAVILGLILACLICIVPTFMLVYNSIRWPKYEKQEETVVEDFKEWSNDSKKNKSLRGAISSLVWTITVVAYFAVSFTTGAWGYTWLIYLVAACIESVVTLVFRMRELRG